MGAEDTLLYQKLSSERAAIPQLDNRSTPRDMATMMQQIADGEAASDKSCQYMIELMDLNELDWWLDAGLPADVYAANKAGWLYEVYDDVGIVKAGDRPYVIAILSKYGSGDVDQGAYSSRTSPGSPGSPRTAARTARKEPFAFLPVVRCRRVGQTQSHGVTHRLSPRSRSC